MKANIMPPAILTIICIIASALLVFVHELTKENISEQKALRFSKSVEALFGETDSTLLDTDFGEDSIEAIATFSSKGMAAAVDTALRVYSENKEAILNGRE